MSNKLNGLTLPQAILLRDSLMLALDTNMHQQFKRIDHVSDMSYLLNQLNSIIAYLSTDTNVV